MINVTMAGWEFFQGTRNESIKLWSLIVLQSCDSAEETSLLFLVSFCSPYLLLSSTLPDGTMTNRRGKVAVDRSGAHVMA